MRLADRLNAPEAESVPGLMAELGRRGRAAMRRLSFATTGEKNAALQAMAAAIRAAAPAILVANAEDLDEAPFIERGGVDGALRDLGDRAGDLINVLNAELTA